MKNLELHPLIDENKDGTNKNAHYDQLDEPAILTMEKEFSIDKMIAWSKITIRKYELRLGFKDEKSKEQSKIDAYTRYKDMLKTLPGRHYLCGEMTPQTAYEALNIEWRYR